MPVKLEMPDVGGAWEEIMAAQSKGTFAGQLTALEAELEAAGAENERLRQVASTPQPPPSFISFHFPLHLPPGSAGL